MRYAFRNKIVLGDKKLTSTHDDTMLYESDEERVGLHVDRRTDNGDAFWVLLEGAKYETAEDAFSAGKLWRQRLSVAFANGGIAADFDSPPYPSRNLDDLPQDLEFPGLLIWAIKTNFRSEGYVEMESARPIDLVVDNDLQPVIAHIPHGLGRRQNLAYGFAHIAMSTQNTDVQFILWVSAIEALIPDEPQIENEDAVTYFEELIDEVKDLKKYNAKVRKKVLNALERGKTANITDLGTELASKLTGEYDGKSAEDFFRENYPVRSAIVHGNSSIEDRPTRQEIQRRLPHMRRFVLDLLTLVTGSEVS